MKDVQGRVLDSLSKKEEDIGRSSRPASPPLYSVYVLLLMLLLIGVVYKAVDGSKDTGLKLEEDLIECERQMTQWEKKLTLEEVIMIFKEVIIL